MDNSGHVTVSLIGPGSNGGIFNIGDTDVSYRAVDDAWNPSSCILTVRVIGEFLFSETTSFLNVSYTQVFSPYRGYFICLSVCLSLSPSHNLYIYIFIYLLSIYSFIYYLYISLSSFLSLLCFNLDFGIHINWFVQHNSDSDENVLQSSFSFPLYLTHCKNINEKHRWLVDPDFSSLFFF